MRIAELIKLNLSRCFTGDAFHFGRILREDAAPVGQGRGEWGEQEQQDPLGKSLCVQFQQGCRARAGAGIPRAGALQTNW